MAAHRPIPRRRSLLARGPIVPAVALFACSACRDEPRLEPIRVEAPVLELLARPELRRELAGGAGGAIGQDLVRPRGSGRELHGAWPALVLTPPAELAYDVPATYPEAVLRVALAVQRGSYAGRGEVRFELELDGRPLLAHALDCGADLPGEDRRWHLFELPIGAGGELRIRSAYDGDQEEPPTVGVGLLRVVVPHEVERRPADQGRPNAVLVLIDTLRADRLGAYGHAREVSPAMDLLARRGTRFERAYSSTAWTVPSTASVLTGLSPVEHGLGFAESYYLADTIQTLAERFQLAGFTTGGFACNPLISGSRGFDQGFETFVEHDWRPSGAVFDEVARWLRANRRRRFFLYVHLVDPHYPYAPTPESAEGLVSAPPPELIEGQLDHFLPRYYADPGLDAARLLASRDHQLDLYEAEILDVDRQVGRLVALLRELGLEEHTVVAVTSDHGEEFLEHGWAGHHNQLFDESVRVPLILAGPGVPRAEVASPVENRFLAPTLLELVGLESPPGLAGRNLVSEEDRRELAARPIFVTNSHGRWADLERRELLRLGQLHSVIHEGWRLVWCPRAETGEELLALYDLGADPDCRSNVAAEHPERAQHMRALIERWIAEGRYRRPQLLPATEATRALLEEIGYVGGG